MRNREEGWQHAKLSGHKNEALVMERLETDPEFSAELARRTGLSPLKSISIGGLYEGSVPSVLGDKTKSKTDLLITDVNGRSAKISIKKSSGGQVYLIGVDRFVGAMEAHYKKIPQQVKRSLGLLFSSATDIGDILSREDIQALNSSKVNQYQKRKNRLVWTTLLHYDPSLAAATIRWFTENIGDIANLCFSRGLAKSEEHWADFVWYINLLNENNSDELFSIPEISEKCESQGLNIISPGSRMGGTTIQLPFGFLQWHQSKMQFHHGLDKLRHLQ